MLGIRAFPRPTSSPQPPLSPLVDLKNVMFVLKKGTLSLPHLKVPKLSPLCTCCSCTDLKDKVLWRKGPGSFLLASHIMAP